MTWGERIVARARGCVGARFRPQGRDPATGLDCVGVAVMAFGLPVMRVRKDYGLRGGSRTQIEREMSDYFDRISPAKAGAGDLLLVEPGPEQLHMIILTPGGYLHADARLRRVVEVPGAAPWPVLGAWRYPDDPERRSH